MTGNNIRACDNHPGVEECSCDGGSGDNAGCTLHLPLTDTINGTDSMSMIDIILNVKSAGNHSNSTKTILPR